MKTLIAGLLFALFLGGGYGGVSAAITKRIIYAEETLLRSNCTVKQTAPMQLTIAACSWTTTGRSKIVNIGIVRAVAARMGVGEVASLIAQDKAQFTPGTLSTRVRGWFLDKDGKVIDRSRTRSVVSPVVLTITSGDLWVVYLVDGPGVTMDVVLQLDREVRPPNTLDYLILPFAVPAGTTDLGGITIEVFTVKPGHAPVKGMFEK